MRFKTPCAGAGSDTIWWLSSLFNYLDGADDKRMHLMKCRGRAFEAFENLYLIGTSAMA